MEFLTETRIRSTTSDELLNTAGDGLDRCPSFCGTSKIVSFRFFSFRARSRLLAEFFYRISMLCANFSQWSVRVFSRHCARLVSFGGIGAETVGSGMPLFVCQFRMVWLVSGRLGCFASCLAKIEMKRRESDTTLDSIEKKAVGIL